MSWEKILVCGVFSSCERCLLSDSLSIFSLRMDRTVPKSCSQIDDIGVKCFSWMMRNFCGFTFPCDEVTDFSRILCYSSKYSCFVGSYSEFFN